MPRLTDSKIRLAIKQTVAAAKSRKLYDEDGLYLQMKPRGSDCGAWWRQRYVFEGREQLLSVGVYPTIGIAKARERGEQIRTQAANDINPSAARKDHKAAQRSASERTFKAITTEWLAKTGGARGWSADHRERVKRRFEVHFFPWLGSKDIATIDDEAILQCVHRVADAELIDTSRRAFAEIDALMRYARGRRYIKVNPIASVRAGEVLPVAKLKHHASLKDPEQVGQLLRAIDAYHGSFVVRSALQFLPLVFVRPGELQHAQWPEFSLDGDKPEWRIPAARMKMRELHVVPLSRQAVAILRELKPVTGADDKGFVFPQARNASRPISENTLNVALRSLGYTNEQQTAHGFRSTASTLLNEQGFNKDWIERQLAHGERDKSRDSYNAAQYLSERRRMMQAWADYLVRLKEGAVS
jgi:integrase